MERPQVETEMMYVSIGLVVDWCWKLSVQLSQAPAPKNAHVSRCLSLSRAADLTQRICSDLLKVTQGIIEK